MSVPRFDIQQADVTPLMSSLIGSAVPVNNIGKLPIEYLDVPEEYACKSVLQNAFQIASQFKHLQNQYKKAFLFKDYHELNENSLLSIEYEIQSAMKAKSYSKAVNCLSHCHFSSFEHLFFHKYFCGNYFR